MDEVDDVGAGDQSGMAELTKMIKGSMVPIFLQMVELAVIAPLGYSKTCLEVRVQVL